MMRERFTFAKLREITARRLLDCKKGMAHPDSVEIIIPHVCWLDLRMDREIFGVFDFAMSDGEPKEIRCNSIRCVIEQFPGERVAMMGNE